MYLVQKRSYQATRNRDGYPDGPMAWTEWETRIEFQDQKRAEGVTDCLNGCAKIGQPNSEWRCKHVPD